MQAAACGEDNTVIHLIANGANVNFQSTVRLGPCCAYHPSLPHLGSC